MITSPLFWLVPLSWLESHSCGYIQVIVTVLFCCRGWSPIFVACSPVMITVAPASLIIMVKIPIAMGAVQLLWLISLLW